MIKKVSINFRPDDAHSIQIIKKICNILSAKGITVDTDIQLEYRDVEEIRQKLATREERYFEVSHYFSLYTPEEKKMDEEGKKYEQKAS